jgi:hypothetical protein
VRSRATVRGLRARRAVIRPRLDAGWNAVRAAFLVKSTHSGPARDGARLARLVLLPVGMNADHVLQWDMHAPGTRLHFAARRAADAYQVIINKDDAVLMTYDVADGGSLLRKSQEIREQLQRLGYSRTPTAVRAPHASGGICWGPAQPLESSIMSILLS